MKRKTAAMALMSGFLLLTGCGSRAMQESAAILDVETTADYTNESDREPAVIIFSVPSVEAETRKILNKPVGDITTDEVLKITEFGDRENNGVTEYFSGEIPALTDLRWFENLQIIELDRSGIYSLGGIENLNHLRILSVRNNHISNIGPVAELTNLVEFDCADNLVNDYSALSGLTGLESLCIGGTWSAGHTDLSPIKNLTKLKRLYAPACGISDISALKNLTELEYLQLRGNSVKSIQELSGLRKLTYLGLRENQITNIDVLYSLPDLETVDLDQNPIPEKELRRYFEPTESDYVTATFRGQIQEEIPVFRFELSAHYEREVSSYALDTLTVCNSSDGSTVQVISIPEMTLFGQTAISTYDKENMGFALEDMNFDGYQDVRLFDCHNGNYLVEWIYLIWNPEIQQFERDSRLNEIPLASFDQEKKLIHGMNRGSASSHDYYTYRYMDGDIQLIEDVSDNSIYINREESVAQIKELLPPMQDTDNILVFQHYMKKKLSTVTYEMEVAEEKFTIEIDGTNYKYSADSGVGQKIRELSYMD